MKLRSIARGLAAVMLPLFAGCAATNDIPRTTVEGLELIDGTRIDIVYAKPNVDLSRYDKVLLAPVSIAYQRSSAELTNRQVARMRREFRGALEDELMEGGYALAAEPAQEVLLLEASIVDLYVNRPTRPSAGRAVILTATSGEMTLMGELRDSSSGEVLVRFSDRERPRSYWQRSTSISEWSEARRAFRFWAGILREGMDRFHDDER